MDEADRDVVTLSEVEHYAYCARQWALIHLDRLWAENEPTAVGHIVHSRVDDVETRAERGGKVARSLTVWSDSHDLFGRADTVEFRDREAPVPVETRAGAGDCCRHAFSSVRKRSASRRCSVSPSCEACFGSTVSGGEAKSRLPTSSNGRS